MGVNRLATLEFTETAGAGVYTAQVGLQPGAIVTDVFLVSGSANWSATTAVLDMGDLLTSATAYFSAYDVDALLAYDPGAPAAGTNYDDLSNAGNVYVPDQPLWPGVQYAAADLLTAVLTATGAGGTTGRLLVQVVGYGIPGATHRAVKV
jgi:hypothetical protein